MADDWVAKTQKDLGAVIQQPKLTEKLLKKPPFKFLHDIITSVQRTTGFPNGLYTPEELDRDKVTEKEAKILFLEKLIICVSYGTQATVNCRAAKVVTGQEPENTNELLQKLAVCAQLPQNKQEGAVRKALKKLEARKEGSAPAPAQPTAQPAEEKPPQQTEEKRKSPPPAQQQPPQQQQQQQQQQQAAPQMGHQQPPQEARPGSASAGKAPPNRQSNTVVERSSAGEAVAAAGVIVESKKRGSSAGLKDTEADADGDKDEKPDWMKLAEQHEKAQNEAANAEVKSGEAKGYIAQKAQEAKRQQEEEEAKKASQGQVPEGEGIVFKTRKKEKSSGGVGDGEVAKLREHLQMLTKASNPLGRYTESIHDDLEPMTRELDMWRSEAKAQTQAAEEAQRQTQEALHEVYATIGDLEDSINDQLLKINSLRANILANDKTIETLLRMVVDPDLGKKK